MYGSHILVHRIVWTIQSTQDEDFLKTDYPERTVEFISSEVGRTFCDETIRKAVSGGARATSSLTAVGRVLRHNVNNESLQTLMDSEQTVKFLWTSDIFNAGGEREGSVSFITNGSMRLTDEDDTVSAGACAANDSQAVVSNHKYVVSTSTTAQLTPFQVRRVSSDRDLENVMDSEQMVKFVWSYDVFNDDKVGKDSGPSLTTKCRTQQEGKQLCGGAIATDGVLAVNGSALPTCITLQSSLSESRNIDSEDNMGRSMEPNQTVKWMWPSSWTNGEEIEDSVPPVISSSRHHDAQLSVDVPCISSTPCDRLRVESVSPVNSQESCREERDSLTSWQLEPRSVSPSEISLSSHYEIDSQNSEVCSENVLQNEFEAIVIPASPTTQPKCMLSIEDEKSVLHTEHCETIAYALDLRSKQSSMLQSFPTESFALDLVDKIIGKSVCRELLLNNQCMSHPCHLVHDVQLNFDLPQHDFKTSFILFSRWYLSNARHPNFKVMMDLLSLMSQDFGDELLLTILCFSRALLKVSQSFRRPLGIKLIQKLVHLLDFTKTNAIRTIVIFNVTQDSEEDIITDLLRSLGVYEEDMTTLYESLSCIWHINGNYSFSYDVFFTMLKECLQEMPPGFALTKGKIIEELLKCPRSVLNKHILVVERFLLKYCAMNSFAAHKVRCVAYYGKIPEPEDDPTRSRSYKSSTVKGFGPINWSWDYLDLAEEAQKSLGRRFCKMLMDIDETEEEATIVHPSYLNVNMEELLDVTDVGSNMKLLALRSNNSPPTGLSKYVSSTREALKHQKYELIFNYILDSIEENCLDSYMTKLGDMLIQLVKKYELPRVVFECLSSVSHCGSQKIRSLIISRFSVTVNSLVLMFYEKRDCKSALKLLDTLRAKGVDLLRYPPNRTDQQVFTVVCSDINFECLRMGDAVKILLSNDCFKYVKFNCTFIISNHFRILERLVVKMLKYFTTKGLSSLSVRLFRAVLVTQKDLFFPIDIGKYYEIVLCNTYEKPCAPLDGARLFTSVYKISGHEEIFRATTFRSLIVELVRLEDSSVDRILELCIHYGVYPLITSGLVSLGTHLLVEEMYVYLNACFKKFSDATEGPASSDRSCTVKLIPTSKPVRKCHPFLEDLKNVETGVFEATERFKEALRRIVDSVECPSPTLDFLSPSEIVIPLIAPPSSASSENEEDIELISNTSIEEVEHASNHLSKDKIDKALPPNSLEDEIEYSDLWFV